MEIEGAKLIACARCADRGTIIRKVYAEQNSPRRLRKKENASEKEKILVENYGEIIRTAREERGISREDLAKKLHIRAGYLQKIEEGELTPTDDVARKLEKILKIQLFQEIEEDDVVISADDREEGPSEITLGDVVRITVVKKK